MSTNLFELGEPVKLHGTKLTGKVIGIATYLESPTSYLVKFVNAIGNPCEDWFRASSLVKIDDMTFKSNLSDV